MTSFVGYRKCQLKIAKRTKFIWSVLVTFAMVLAGFNKIIVMMDIYALQQIYLLMELNTDLEIWQNQIEGYCLDKKFSHLFENVPILSSKSCFIIHQRAPSWQLTNFFLTLNKNECLWVCEKLTQSCCWWHQHICFNIVPLIIHRFMVIQGLIT